MAGTNKRYVAGDDILSQLLKRTLQPTDREGAIMASVAEKRAYCEAIASETIDL